VRQGQAIPDPARRAAFDHEVAIKLPEWQTPEVSRDWVAERAKQLVEHHGDLADCRIVAEVEACVALGGDPEHAVLLTFDRRLRTRLQPHTQVRLLAPSTSWDSLGIPSGASPRWTPTATNPLASANWWRW